MGQAKRRADALRRFQPLADDLHVCPDRNCRSRDTVVRHMDADILMSHVGTLMGVCRTCGVLWEAFPPGWQHDVVGADPCDNCAFRPGAPEHRDGNEWRSMLAKLKAGQEFKCHKGAPIRIDAEAGTRGFDEAWVRMWGRTCAGFHKAIQTKGTWLENRIGVLHVLTVQDQDQLLQEGRT